MNIYIKEEIFNNGISKISMHASDFPDIKDIWTFIDHEPVKYNYYNIPGFVSRKCAEEICKKFNKEKITKFIDAIMFVQNVAEPYLIIEKLME